jgi:serine/threonine protein kinase/tetratricopeptide (TPR) repeat protein
MPDQRSETATPTPEPAKALVRGQTIGRYVVLGLVGRGGMGEVYAAYDPELERKVAVKLVRARPGSTEGGRLRLLREAQATAQLSHPNVVVVYDVGTFRESVFIAMEFIEGGTVGYWLQAERRSQREILNVFLAAGRGLAAAHEAGLVHRDFKPENIMLTHDRQVRVMDFGLARSAAGPDDRATPTAPKQVLALAAQAAKEAAAAEADREGDIMATRALGPLPAIGDRRTSSTRFLATKITQTGAQTGTPAYMAPEQFARTKVDGRTDQFSFCVALYEALYGERPFTGSDLTALMTAVTLGEVQPAPAGSHVPGWIRKILLQGLQVDPERRFPTMEGLLAALEADPSARRRNRLLVGALVAAVAGLAVTAHHLGGRSNNENMCAAGGSRLAGVWEPAPGSPRRTAIRRAMLATGAPDAERAFAGAGRFLDRYATDWRKMYREACEATHVRGEQSAEVLDLRMSCLRERLGNMQALTDLLASADASMVGNAVQAASALPSLERCADVKSLRAIVPPPDDPKKRHHVEELRGELARFTALKDTGQCDAAEKTSSELITRVRETAYTPLLAQTLDAASKLGDVCGDPVISVDRAREAYYAAIESRDDRTAADAAVVVAGLAADRLGQVRTARDWVGIGRATVRRIGKDPLLESTVLVAEGTTLAVEGKHREALAEYQRAVELQKAILGPDHPITLASIGNVGNEMVAAGDFAEGLEVTTQALKGLERVFGGHDAWVAMSNTNRCEALNRLSRYTEAREACQRAVDISRLAKTDPFMLAYGLVGLGIACLGDGHPADARPVLEEAFRIRSEKHADAEHIGEVRFALARALWFERDERARALSLARDAKADYASLAGHQPEKAEIDAWLGGHR